MPISMGSWVRTKADRGLTGFVASTARSHQASVRFLGAGKARWVSKKSLRGCRPPMVLYLEGNLDKDLQSRRTGMDTLRGWCDAYGVDFASKTVHRLDDLEVLARSLNVAAPPAFVHLACHGDQSTEKSTSYLSFTGGRTNEKARVYLDSSETWEAFRRLSKKNVRALLLDACLVGRYEDQLRRFCTECGFDFVAASPRAIDDYESLIIATTLYYAALHQGLRFDKAVNKVVKALSILGIRGTPGSAQALLRVFSPS